MDIKKFADLKALQEIQDLFSDATGLAAIAVDAEGNYITTGSNFTDFCMKYTRGTKMGAERCVKCDNECTGTYFCHAGLMDFASDIIVNGERVGAIIGGQVLPTPPDLDKFRAIARELGIDEETYLRALDKVPIRNEKMIRAAAKMLGQVVNQLVNLQYLQSFTSSRVETFNKEVSGIEDSVSKVISCLKELQNTAKKEKILAINASVEAARAGKEGVGFVVVAKEIENLSRQSAYVYSDVETHILAIESSVHKIGTTNL